MLQDAPKGIISVHFAGGFIIEQNGPEMDVGTLLTNQIYQKLQFSYVLMTFYDVIDVTTIIYYGSTAHPFWCHPL